MMKKRKSGAVAKKKQAEEPRKVVVAAAAAQGESRVASSSQPVASMAAAERVAPENRWGVADEQMSWGAQWSPYWEVDLEGEAYLSSLYSDVWDGYDDIWGFRTSDQLPPPHKPPPTSK